MKMKTKIEFTTYANETAEAVVSRALGFDKELSHSAIVDIFAKDIKHTGGVFKTKKAAKIVADAINQRGSFGGFGEFKVTARVVAA
jgi:hypothetical protein